MNWSYTGSNLESYLPTVLDSEPTLDVEKSFFIIDCATFIAVRNFFFHIALFLNIEKDAVQFLISLYRVHLYVRLVCIQFPILRVPPLCPRINLGWFLRVFD